MNSDSPMVRWAQWACLIGARGVPTAQYDEGPTGLKYRAMGDVLMTPAEIEAACARVPEKLKADIRFAQDNVRRFAEAQKATVSDVQLEIVPGFIAGQKAIPVDAAGCYVPGGRYSHVASAIMTVTTAKVAGCPPGRRQSVARHSTTTWRALRSE